MAVGAGAATTRPGTEAARWWWVRAAIVGTLLAAIYRGTLTRLWDVWRNNGDASHGPLVPLVSLAIAWWLRERFRAAPAQAEPRALVAVAAACALQVLGVRSDVLMLQGLSLVLLVPALLWLEQGLRRVRVLVFPLAFLLFMLPVPGLIVSPLSFALKQVTITLSTRFAELFGADVVRHGTTLFLRGGELRVENPCSGLRSLIALFATATGFAWAQPGGAGRKLVMAFAAIPLAMLGNILRITLLIVVGHYAGIRAATGRVHDVAGVVLIAAALAGLLALRVLLTPKRPEAAA